MQVKEGGVRHIMYIIPWFICATAFPKSLDLSSAFKSLVSTTQPGVYKSQVRGYMTGGSVSVHFPSRTVHLVNVSPPHFSSGCGGIDLYMGGLSYISGKQFIALLKGIAANTMGYSFSLAMRTLCPICSTVVASLQKVAQAANHLAVRQCQFAMGLVNTVTGMQAKSRAQKMGALASANLGLSRNFLSGLNKMSGSVTKAIDALSLSIKRIEDRGVQNQHVQATQYGSRTWKLLSGLSVAQKVFIQSVLGTTVHTIYLKKHRKEIVVEPIAASMTIKQLANVFIYGVEAKNPNNATLLVNSCEHAGGRGNRFSSKGINICEHVIKKLITQSVWYKNTHAKVKGISIKKFRIVFPASSSAGLNPGKILSTPNHRKTTPRDTRRHTTPCSAIQSVMRASICSKCLFIHLPCDRYGRAAY